ncbi:MAG: hypothetical protein LEGION0403_FIIPPAGN_02174 [Legionella sp.]|uniref:DUF3861 family protein n=1 Tax=Legionella sp. TaxID=459 RepID=UPI003D1017D4
MKSHEYAICVKPLGDETSNELAFTARSHDDLFTIVERAKQRVDLNENDATCLAIGFKLLGNIVLENRKAPLFTDLGNALHAFVNQLKKGK